MSVVEARRNAAKDSRDALRETRQAALATGDRVVEQIKKKKSDPPKQ